MKKKFTYKKTTNKNAITRVFIGTWNEFQDKLGDVLIINVEDIEEEGN